MKSWTKTSLLLPSRLWRPRKKNLRRNLGNLSCCWKRFGSHRMAFLNVKKTYSYQVKMSKPFSKAKRTFFLKHNHTIFSSPNDLSHCSTEPFTSISCQGSRFTLMQPCYTGKVAWSGLVCCWYETKTLNISMSQKLLENQVKFFEL